MSINAVAAKTVIVIGRNVQITANPNVQKTEDAGFIKPMLELITQNKTSPVTNCSPF